MLILFKAVADPGFLRLVASPEVVEPTYYFDHPPPENCMELKNQCWGRGVHTSLSPALTSANATCELNVDIKSFSCRKIWLDHSRIP